MTKLIVLLSLLCIGKHCIGFLCFLELFFTLFIPRVHVGMILFGKSTECFLDLIVRCGLAYAQDLIIISLIRHNFSSIPLYCTRGFQMSPSRNPMFYTLR